ncbi:hypothetical protein REPUB_Repub18cG0024500 [Reevesia pubescens]
MIPRQIALKSPDILTQNGGANSRLTESLKRMSFNGSTKIQILGKELDQILLSCFKQNLKPAHYLPKQKQKMSTNRS